MEKATLYDYARICKAFKNNCGICPMCIGNNGTNELCAKLVMKFPDKANEIILNWCKEHPVKTRQDEFLKMFPNARIIDGIVGICPKPFETTYACKAANSNCINCRKSYWLAEVDEHDAK